MEIYTSYKVKIRHYNHIFEETIRIYRDSIDFFLSVILEHRDGIFSLKTGNEKLLEVERLTIRTKKNPEPEHPFEDADKRFYKMPSYLRRAAIMEAIGKVSSYLSSLENWKKEDPSSRGKRPGIPNAGYSFPSLYRDNMYKQDGEYAAQVKVFRDNTWDWLTVSLRKSDMDYISRHCKWRKQCAPSLVKKGKEWFLVFPFQEKAWLPDVTVYGQVIASVDLGVNSAATISVMSADGTILGRRFLRLPKEEDSLRHALNRIKKAQQHGNRKTPGLWAKVDGINQDIAAKTACFIMEAAFLYSVDCIVFEHLDLGKKKKGSKKQRLHLWKAKAVQAMTAIRAHRAGIRISRVNAWNTSRLAFDGSGRVLRGEESEKAGKSYSICEFKSGKVYHCDLNASYNIGARYFIRELLKSLPETERLGIGAKVPRCTRRSTCTLSDLIDLYAAIAA